jgi:creatinine amidohydrolase
MFELTSEDVKALDPERTCVTFTISPIEEHGPHLPLSTDVIEAEGMLDRLLARLDDDFPEWTFLRYPPIPLGVDGFEYPGTASIRPATMRSVVEELVTSFEREGFTRFMVSSHHGSPRHNLALEDAASRLAKKTDARVLSLAGQVIVDLYLDGGLNAFYDRMGISSDEHATFDVDCHAGAFETSEMLALRPELVRDEYKELPPVLVPLEKLTVLSAKVEGEGLGYFGDPQLSDAEFGREYMDFVVDRIYDHVVEFMETGEFPRMQLRWRAALKALGLVSKVRETMQKRAGEGEGG